MKRRLSFENIPKSLECFFPIFLLSKWLQVEFCHSKIHFLSVVLSRFTLSHSHACQVLAWVSWEQQEEERKWEAQCFIITQSALRFGNNGSEGSILMGWIKAEALKLNHIAAPSWVILGSEDLNSC